MKDEIYDIIDENDKVIGKGTWKYVHSLGLLHQTVAGFVFEGQNRNNVLLQKRSHTMIQDPDKFTLSVGGHILIGETPVETIYKELEEELIGKNIDRDAIQLNNIGIVDVEDIPGNHEHLHFYEIFYGGTFVTDPKEVSFIEWLKWEDLMELYTKQPEKFTRVFKICLDFYLSHRS
ncbi:MAG: NUDIX domain-containing protein [Patescibacteria group bacterium]